MFVSIAWCFGRILGSARLSILWILLAEWRALMYILYVQAAHVRVAIWMLWLLSQDRQSYNSNANTCISVGRSDANGVLPSPCYSAPSQSLSTILPLSIVRYSTNTSTTIQGYPIRFRILNASHLTIRKNSLFYPLNSPAKTVVVLFSC